MVVWLGAGVVVWLGAGVVVLLEAGVAALLDSGVAVLLGSGVAALERLRVTDSPGTGVVALVHLFIPGVVAVLCYLRFATLHVGVL